MGSRETDDLQNIPSRLWKTIARRVNRTLVSSWVGRQSWWLVVDREKTKTIIAKFLLDDVRVVRFEYRSCRRLTADDSRLDLQCTTMLGPLVGAGAVVAAAGAAGYQS